MDIKKTRIIALVLLIVFISITLWANFTMAQIYCAWPYNTSYCEDARDTFESSFLQTLIGTFIVSLICSIVFLIITIILTLKLKKSNSEIKK